MKYINKEAAINCYHCNAITEIGKKECGNCERDNPNYVIYQKYKRINISIFVLFFSIPFSPIIGSKIGVLIGPDILFYPIMGMLVLIFLGAYYKRKCLKEIRVSKYERIIKILKNICFAIGLLSLGMMVFSLSLLTPQEQMAFASSGEISPLGAVCIGSFVVWVILDLMSGLFDGKSEE